MDDGSALRPAPIERLRYAWRAARLWLVFAAGLIGTTLALSLPVSQQQSTVGLSLNDVAQQDIPAPYALAFTSELLTEQAREAAAGAVPEVFDPPDGQVARQQIEQLRATLDFIDAVRADAQATEQQQLEDLSALADVRFDPETAQTILNMPEPRWQAAKLEAISVLEQVMRSEIREDRLETARRTVPALVSISMPVGQADIVVQLASAFLVPNARYNEEATEAARAQARLNVTPVVKSYAAGESIVNRGEVVTELHLEALEEYGLLQPVEFWRELAIRGLLVTVLAAALVLYGFRVHPHEIAGTRMAAMLAVAFAVIALAMQFMIPGRTVLPYLFPAATFPMMLAILFSPGMGIVAALVSGALAGFLAPRGLELSLLIMLSGSMGALLISRAERLSAFFWAGLGSALAAVAVVVIFRFPDPSTDLVGKASLLGAAVLSGLLSASLGFALLLLVSNLLGITTNLQLIELSRPDHPLLQFILRNAPGTYQHSLQVANLAEQAARVIGANALLTRIGALYHDAGKALRPQFFIENQVAGQNIHDQLDPTTSANIILAHVRDGLELARKHRLPRAIQAFIAEHHGTLEATYQYNSALEAVGGASDRVDRRDFTYPGPRPRSRETALLMMADGVEARARAEAPKDDEQIEEIVRWVIQDRLNRGQFDRTNLTLKDLDSIRRSFVSTLRGMYHPRLRYPSVAAEEPGEARALEASTTPQADPR